MSEINVNGQPYDFGSMSIAESLKKDWDAKPTTKPLTVCEKLAIRVERVAEGIIALEAKIARLNQSIDELPTKKAKAK